MDLSYEQKNNIIHWTGAIGILMVLVVFFSFLAVSCQSEYDKCVESGGTYKETSTYTPDSRYADTETSCTIPTEGS